MIKIIADKFFYIVAVLIIMAVTFVGSLNQRVSALERSDGMNSLEHQTTEKGIDSVDRKVSKILCILGEKSSCN